MNKLTFFSALITATMISVGVTGQQHPRGERNLEKIAENRADRMKSELGLSDQQYASIREINLKYARQIHLLRSDTAADRRTVHKEVKEVQDKRKQEVAQVLTDEQEQKWTEIRKDRREKRGDSYGRSNGGSEKLKTELGLSDDQAARLKAAFGTFREKARTIRADASLSEDAKKTRFQTLRKEHDATVKGILSPEQYQKWTQMKSDRREKAKKLRRGHHFQK